MDIRILLLLFSMCLADEDIADFNGIDQKQLDDELGPIFPYEAFGIGYEDFLKKVHPPLLSAMNYRPVMPYDIPQIESTGVITSVASALSTTESGIIKGEFNTENQSAEDWEEVNASSSEEFTTEVGAVTEEFVGSSTVVYHEDESVVGGTDTRSKGETTEESMGGSNADKSGSITKSSHNDQSDNSDKTTTIETRSFKDTSDKTKASSKDTMETSASTTTKESSKLVEDSISDDGSQHFVASDSKSKAMSGKDETLESDESDSESSEFMTSSGDDYSEDYFYFFPGYMYADSSESDESDSSYTTEESFSTEDVETQLQPNRGFLADKVEIINSFDISYHDYTPESSSISSVDSSSLSKSSQISSVSESRSSSSQSSKRDLTSKSGTISFSASGDAAVSTSFSMGKHVGSSGSASSLKQSREMGSTVGSKQRPSLEELKKIVEESYSELSQIRKKLFKRENVLNELNQVIDDLQKMCDKICRTVPPQYMIEDPYSR